MGQYHYVCNYDRKQFLHPHKFKDGLKLMEFGVSGNGTMAALAILLAASNTPTSRGGGDLHPWLDGPGYEGRERDTTPERGDWLMKNVVGAWAGDRIAIVGDYCEDEDAYGLVGREGSPTKNEDDDEYEKRKASALKIGSTQPLSTKFDDWTDVSGLALEALELDYYVHKNRNQRLSA